MSALDLPALLDSWTVHLRAERKSPRTIDSYVGGVRLFLRWAAEAGVAPELDRPTVNAFTADQLEAGFEAATVVARLQGVRRFSAWLAAEEEVPRDELVGIRPPKLDEKVVPRLSEEECRALVKSCQGKGFRDRRDEAIVRLLLDGAVRAGELIDMRVDDVNLSTGLATVRRGKGGRARTVPFGPQTARALDRYLRLRRGHRLAGTGVLWLGDRSSGFGYHAMRKALRRRAELAGVAGFHPHVTRHTAAQRWLAAGGSEGGLMTVAGWRRRDMLDRYTRATAAERAAEESRRLNLGDL